MAATSSDLVGCGQRKSFEAFCRFVGMGSISEDFYGHCDNGWIAFTLLVIFPQIGGIMHFIVYAYGTSWNVEYLVPFVLGTSYSLVLAPLLCTFGPRVVHKYTTGKLFFLVVFASLANVWLKAYFISQPLDSVPFHSRAVSTICVGLSV